MWHEVTIACVCSEQLLCCACRAAAVPAAPFSPSASHVLCPSPPACLPALPGPQVLVRRHGCPRSSLVLLYRHSPAELDSMVQLAVERVPAAAVAVASARQRRAAIEAGAHPRRACG